MLEICLHPQEADNLPEQNLWVVRLGDMIDAAVAPVDDMQGQLGISGEHDHRDMPRLAAAADDFGCQDSVGAQRIQVKYNQLNTVLLNEVQYFMAGVGWNQLKLLSSEGGKIVDYSGIRGTEQDRSVVDSRVGYQGQV